jgi:glycerol-3-phosphate dehydrogenase
VAATNRNNRYDVVIIGAGIAGAATARELSKYRLSIAVVEKEPDFCFGATKGSHALVHCGLPGQKSPLKDKGELEGNLLMEDLCKELDVPFRRIGKLLVAFDPKEVDILKEIEMGAKRNGVSRVELISDRSRLKGMEPNISDEIIAALYTPTTGIANPWSLVIGLMENAIENGTRVYLNAQVTGIEETCEGDFLLTTLADRLRGTYVINAAGVHADRVAQMVGDKSFKIIGSRHQRIILDKEVGGHVKHLVRGLSGTTPVGNFVTPTIDGNIMIGSKLEIFDDVEDVKTTQEGLVDWVLPQSRRFIPTLPPDLSIKPFAAFLPMVGSDYHVNPAPDSPRFVNLVLGVSGFTAAPAMARYVTNEILPSIGLKLEGKQEFNPRRKDIPHFYNLNNKEKGKLIAKNPLYGQIVCRCETVSVGEIIDATHRGATTRDGVKFRTRAGMGRCQSNFCGHKVLEIMERQLVIPMHEITRKGKGSEELAKES